MRVLLFANTDWFLFNFKLTLVQALRARGDEVILLSPSGDYGPKLREMGFRWEAVPVSRSGINPLAELAVIRRLASLYRDWRPAVVHHFTIKCVIYGSIAARLAGVKAVVNSITGLGFALLAKTPKARLIRPVVLSLYRFALRGTEVVFQNRDNRATLERHGVLASCHVHVIPGDGIDTRRFMPPLQRPEGCVVLMMARLLRSKGVAEYVAAARQVRRRFPEARFLLAGAPDPGNPESVDDASLEAWRGEGVVEFLGHRSDAVELNQTADIVVLASTQGEGIPRALLEGAACAAPMVATDVPGCREVVRDGETGFLVAPGDPVALADGIARLIADPALRRAMGAAARAAVERKFSDACVIGQTLALYASATGEP